MRRYISLRKVHIRFEPKVDLEAAVSDRLPDNAGQNFRIRLDGLL